MLRHFRLAEIEAEKLTKNEICKKTQQGINLLIHFISDIESSDLPVVQLTSQVQSTEEAPTVFVLPGFEGAFKPLEVLTSSLKAHVVGIRYNNKHPENSIEEIAKNMISVCFSSTCVFSCFKSVSIFSILNVV